jgi:uncharacterized phage protein gp47/JayE
MSPAQARDRRRAVVEGVAHLNGIDFVTFDEGAIEVHFLTLVALREKVVRATISGGWPVASTRTVLLHGRDWSSDEIGRPVLRIPFASPEDASTYRLVLEGGPLDPYLSRAPFSFQGFIPRTVDCEAPKGVPVPQVSTLPPIDYLAKDFASFKQALLDFSAQSYPAWQERSEADFGVMFLEALSSIADDLSYQQDRIASEAFLATATERVSLVRHARLVDYEPRPATASRVMLQLTVSAGPIPGGLPVSAVSPDGTVIDFETGEGLSDKQSYPANPLWNALTPYWWDDAARVLPAGATEMWIGGSGLGLAAGVVLLIDTATADPTASVRQQVTLTDAIEEKDPLFGVVVTHLYWGMSDALEKDRDLAATTVGGNLVPATQGTRYLESFAIGTSLGVVPAAIVRTGANGTAQYLYSLRHAPLAWLAPLADPTAQPVPEIVLVRTDDSSAWIWSSSLLDAGAGDAAFTVDPVVYQPVGSQQPDGTIPMDYAGSDGDTIRFGDGSYGMVPDSPSTFQVLYRAGGGAAGNVAADTITRVGPAGEGLIVAVTNPFPATGGADPESADDIRLLAPYAFSAAQPRAIVPADYESLAESLPWVQDARTSFRYTGSWVDAFTRVAADESRLPTDDELRGLAGMLDQSRLMGRASYVLPPRYVALDVAITVHAAKHAQRSDVRTALRNALSALTFTDGKHGFFAPGRFTLGQALERGRLEKAIHCVPGVDWIAHILFRRHGLTDSYEEMPARVIAASDEIFRVDGNPERPDAGTVRVDVEGGR